MIRPHTSVKNAALDGRWVFEGYGGSQYVEMADTELYWQREELHRGVMALRRSMEKLKMVPSRGRWRARARVLGRAAVTSDRNLPRRGEGSFLSLSFVKS